MRWMSYRVKLLYSTVPQLTFQMWSQTKEMHGSLACFHVNKELLENRMQRSQERVIVRSRRHRIEYMKISRAPLS